jgi:hypothetical protein
MVEDLRAMAERAANVKYLIDHGMSKWLIARGESASYQSTHRHQVDCLALAAELEREEGTP